MSSYRFYYHSLFLIIIYFTIFPEITTCDSTKCNCVSDICQSCRDTYHFSRNEVYFSPAQKTCYSLSDFPANYYYDPSTGLIEECNERCQTCETGVTPSIDNHKCILCTNGYYKKDGDTKTGNCYLPSEIDNNYYYDSSSQTFKECYDRCNTCSELGDSTDNKCDSCKNAISTLDDQYYKMDTYSTGNCYLVSEIPSYYNIPLETEFNEEATIKINIRSYNYQSGDQYKILIYERIARKCYKNCDSCDELGDDDDMKCITCITNYYFYKNNCYKKCPKPDTYQLKDSNFQCRELVDGYQIITDYRTSNDIIDFLIYHGLNEFDFEKDLIVATKMYGQVYSFKNKNTNDELADKLKLSKIFFSESCIQNIVKYYNLENDMIEDLILIKIDRNYTDSRSKKKSTVNQVDYYLFYPDYDIDENTDSKTVNGTYHEINLNICQEDEIIINKPIINYNETLTGMELKKAVDIYNSNNDYDIFDVKSIFFSDICSSFKSEKGKDVTIQERQQKYFQNISFCEGNCIFSKFDYENYRINCSCNSSINLLYTQYNLSAYKDRRNIIKNLTYSTLSNIFPKNTSKSYEYLNLKTMKCTNLIFDINIAIKNFGNWFALILAIAKIYFLGYFLTKRFLPINEEYNKRKSKIEKEFLAQIPDAKIMTQEDLQKIPKLHIEKVVWSNYAGSFKYDKRKKNRQRGLITNDGEANKFTYNGLLMNYNHVEFPTLEDDKNEKKKQNIENNKNNKNPASPPKRFGYIYTDDRADEKKESENVEQIFESAERELKYKKNKNLSKSKFFEKGGGIDMANLIFPTEKTDITQYNNSNENEKKNEDEDSENIKNYYNKNSADPVKMDEMIKEQMPIDYDKIQVEMKDKIRDPKNDKLKFNVAKLNQLINDEIDFKNDQKARKEFNDNKAKQEEDRNYLNKQKEKNNGKETEKEKNKKKRLKKFGNQNYLEDPDEVAKYKKGYLDDEDVGQNVFRIEPAINYRFSSMNSTEKLLFMKFRYAIDLDRRTFKEIYLGCIKMSQLVMNFIYVPYYFQMKFLKFYFATFVANLNVLTTTIFYSSFYKGEMYGFKILMCFLESIFVSVMLYLFSFSKKKFTSVHVLDIHRFAKMKKTYSIIVVILIIVEIIISAFIWYLSSAFCSVYQNDNIFYFLHLIESIIINLAFPFALSVIPTILRYFALVNENKVLFYINNVVDVIF